MTSYAIDKRYVLVWSVNKHCPVRFEDIFLPLDGVHVENTDEPSFQYQISTRELCWFYIVNPQHLPAEEFVPRVKHYYRYVLSRLAHRPPFELPAHTAGVSYRSFFPPEQLDSLETFLPKIGPWLESRAARNVFVAADHQGTKQAIADHLHGSGFEVFTHECPLLTHDFDRSLENIAGFSQELVLFSQCTAGIIANSTRSTVTDSARAFDIPIHRTHDDGRYRGRDLKFGGDFFLKGLEAL